MNKRALGDCGGTLVFTISAALLSSCLLLLFFSESFFDSFLLFFINPLTNRYYLGNMIAFMAPLIVAGLGIAFAFESHNFNLGGEGQLYSGSLAAVLVGFNSYLDHGAPMEPVMVPGWATMRSAAMDTKYPPEAATLPMDTTTGLPAARASARAPGPQTRHWTGLSLCRIR